MASSLTTESFGSKNQTGTCVKERLEREDFSSCCAHVWAAQLEKELWAQTVLKTKISITGFQQ